MSLEIDEQPSFPDLFLASFENDTEEAEVSSLRDISRRVQEEINFQDRECHCKVFLPLSEGDRKEIYGCPSRSKQLEALVHSLRLIEDKSRPQIISATGEDLVL